MLDLNLWPSGNGRTKGTVSKPGVQIVSTRSKEKPSAELKAVQAFTAILNTLTFNPRLFAAYIMRAETVIQERILACLIACVDLLAESIDNGLAETEEDFELAYRAMRARDAMQAFRDAEML